MYSYFSFCFILKIETNRLKTNTACIKLSYLLVLPVCTDKICIITFKLMRVDLMVSLKRVCPIN